jgi:hypothetical protein
MSTGGRASIGGCASTGDCASVGLVTRSRLWKLGGLQAQVEDMLVASPLKSLHVAATGEEG